MNNGIEHSLSRLTYTFTHTHIYIYIYILVCKNSAFEIYIPYVYTFCISMKDLMTDPLQKVGKRIWYTKI